MKYLCYNKISLLFFISIILKLKNTLIVNMHFITFSTWTKLKLFFIQKWFKTDKNKQLIKYFEKGKSKIEKSIKIEKIINVIKRLI